jgi:folylpolyglutamate synthase/dihydropteroate synthase
LEEIAAEKARIIKKKNAMVLYLTTEKVYNRIQERRVERDAAEVDVGMIDFKDEIQKYKPVLGTDEADKDVDAAADLDEVKDILDLLQDIAGRINTDKE